MGLNEFGDNVHLEAFLMKCAQMNGVYTMGLFDCCRRNRGRSSVAKVGGINMISIYREDIQEFTPRSCPCQQPSVNMAEEFFQHLKELREEREDGGTEIPDDINSFRKDTGGAIPYVRGWFNLEASHMNITRDNLPSFFPDSTVNQSRN